MKSVVKSVAALAAVVQPLAAQAAPVCPPTVAAAQAMLAKQGVVRSNGDWTYYKPDGLNILGVTPTEVSSGPQTALWSFSMRLQARLDNDLRGKFRALYPQGGPMTYSCPTTNMQCYWSAPGWGAHGLEPEKAVVGSLLATELRMTLDTNYSLGCIYYFKRGS